MSAAGDTDQDGRTGGPDRSRGEMPYAVRKLRLKWAALPKPQRLPTTATAGRGAPPRRPSSRRHSSSRLLLYPPADRDSLTGEQFVQVAHRDVVTGGDALG